MIFACFLIYSFLNNLRKSKTAMVIHMGRHQISYKSELVARAKIFIYVLIFATANYVITNWNLNGLSESSWGLMFLAFNFLDFCVLAYFGFYLLSFGIFMKPISYYYIRTTLCQKIYLSQDQYSKVKLKDTIKYKIYLLPLINKQPLFLSVKK